MNWLLARLREPSTWRGLVWLLTALGVSLSPDAWAHITTIGMAAAGLIGVITREDPTQVEIQLPPIDLVGESQAGRADAQPCPGPGNTGTGTGQLRQPVPSDTPSDGESTGWDNR